MRGFRRNVGAQRYTYHAGPSKGRPSTRREAEFATARVKLANIIARLIVLVLWWGEQSTFGPLWDTTERRDPLNEKLAETLLNGEDNRVLHTEQIP